MIGGLGLSYEAFRIPASDDHQMLVIYTAQPHSAEQVLLDPTGSGYGGRAGDTRRCVGTILTRGNEAMFPDIFSRSTAGAMTKSAIRRRDSVCGQNAFASQQQQLDSSTG